MTTNAKLEKPFRMYTRGWAAARVFRAAVSERRKLNKPSGL